MDDLEQSALSGDANAQYAFAALLGASLTHPEYQSLLFYSASTGGHPLALLAQGWRHYRGIGVPESCQTAALYYLEIARSVAGVYSQSVPQAVELVRLSLHDLTGQTSPAPSLSVEEISLFNTMAASDANIAFQLAKRHLLGTDGVSRSYARALELLTMHPSDPRCQGLLGYLYVMGLGVAVDLERARQLFAQSTTEALGNNGMGYLEFKAEKFTDAFRHFNASAYAGSSDGLFNLASLYLAGQGTSQSFQRAYVYYSQAAEMGHTPATYALGIMLLNGIGVGRDCKAGVRLLKEVGERSPVVAELLKKNSRALLHYVLLAEAGVEVAQSNAAFLIEKGGSIDGTTVLSVASMQRYLELSADQGGVSSELKLGDLAYYGRGVDVVLDQEPAFKSRTSPDYALALASYRKCLETSDAGLAAVAAFNLGFMHEFGEGVSRDFSRALEFYGKSLGTRNPVFYSLVHKCLSLHEYIVNFSWSRFSGDWRVQALVTGLAAVPGLVLLRRGLVIVG